METQNLEQRSKICSKVTTCDRVCSNQLRQSCIDYVPFLRTEQPCRVGHLAYLLPYVIGERQ